MRNHTDCLKMALLVIQNEASASELGRAFDKSRRLKRFVEELKTEAGLKDLNADAEPPKHLLLSDALLTIKNTLRDAQMYIESMNIDFSKMQPGPDNDPHYKPEFPEIVRQCSEAIKLIETPCIKSDTPIYAILGTDETPKQVFTKQIVAESVFADLYQGCRLAVSDSPIHWKPL